ncbi:HNH endonuclease [Candidatus Poriferisodalis sp.]|uniref:HNH endonuclease signature motif containing protein n=1 Tax=Candidatus Poriferisodalis sp. TaxID=3101277 RepID=UPI003B01E396
MLFGDVVRELAASPVDADDVGSSGDGGGAGSVWATAGSAWPSEAAVWSGGRFGRSGNAVDDDGSAGTFASVTGVGAAGLLDASAGRDVVESTVTGGQEVLDSGGGVPVWGSDDDEAAGGALDVGRGVSLESGDRTSSGDAFDAAGLGSLRDGELRELMVELAAERARVEGRYMAVVGEFASRKGAQCAAYVLRDRTRANCSQARSEARLGEALVNQGMTETLGALCAGEVSVAHARVIAREAPKAHRRSEAEFLELCRTYPSDVVARHPFAYQSQQVWDDLAVEAAAKGLSPVDAEIALQRHQRCGSIRRGDDGMWLLRAKLDAITGRHVSTAIQAAVRTARNRTSDNSASGGGDGDCLGEGADLSRGQLTADAIADLIAGKQPARRAGTSLMIIADYDLVNDKLTHPRLDDGTPLSARLLAEHAVDAKVLPAVFSADWKQLALGQSRNANDAQRLVLAARDQGCIGCHTTSEHTQAHHIRHYEHGGPTDIDNLTLLCEPCHHNLHDRGGTIHTPANGKPQLQPHPYQPPPAHSTRPPPRALGQTPAPQTQPNDTLPAGVPQTKGSGLVEHTPPTAADCARSP